MLQALAKPHHRYSSCRKHRRTALLTHGAAWGSRPTSAGRQSKTFGAAAAAATPRDGDNPDLDEIILDDAYYEEIGMTREQAMRQQREVLYSADPDAVPLDELSQLSSVDPSSLPPDLRQAVESLQVYGPQALIMAGFRAEEYAVVRATLDSLGAHQVKVLPASHDMLINSVERALQQPEIDWSAPRPPEWILGGTWGSQRTMMFAGMSIKVQATLLELLEAQGLPHLCVTMALEEDAHRRLGDVLAEAVKAQRGYTPPPIAPWERPLQQQQQPSTTTSSSSTSSSSSRTASSPSSPPSAAAAGDSSSSSSRRGGTGQGRSSSWVPGKRGPLFQRRPGSSSSSNGSSSSVPDRGLEPLQDLIPPEVARARLKVNPSSVVQPDLSEFKVPEATAAAEGAQEQQPVTSLPDADASDQALLDWFNNDLGGDVVELPWSEDESSTTSAAKTAAAAGHGFADARETHQQPPPPQQQHQGGPPPAAEVDSAGSLDDLLAAVAAPLQQNVDSNSSNGTSSLLDELLLSSTPRQPQPSITTHASAPAVSAATGVPPAMSAAAEGDGGKASVLSAIQAALKSGVSPEQLKQLIDATAAAGSQASDAVDLMLNEGAATSRGNNNNNSTTAASSQQRQPPKAATTARSNETFGPQPPPAGAAAAAAAPGPEDDPLLKLRPDIAHAMANNQIKFVDLSKLPKKYRQQYTLSALQQQRQQQQQQQLLQQQQEQEAATAAAAEREQQQKQTKGQQRWWQQQSKRQQLAQQLPAQVLGRLPTGGRLVELDVGGSDGNGNGSSSNGATNVTDADNVRPMFDLSNSAGAVTGLAAGSGVIDASEYTAFLNEDPFRMNEYGEAMAPGAGQYDAEYEDLSGSSPSSSPAPATPTAAGYGPSHHAREDALDAEFSGDDADDGWQEEEEKDGEEEERLELDEVKLQQLVNSTLAEGLDVPRALAEALAFGVHISPEVAAAVGVAMPDPDLVAAAREEIIGNIKQMQEARAQEDGDEMAEEQAVVAAGTRTPSGVSGRSWGAGLTQAVQRAKARAVARKQQQN